jgi:putative membrane protein
MPAFLHIGHDLTSGAWHFEPSVLGIAIVVVGVYIFAVSLEPEPFPWRRIAFFFAGALVMLLALVSPLDVGADRLLSLHMLQHVALTTIGPPLVLLGLPVYGLREVLMRSETLHRAFNFVTLPLVTAAFFVVNMWFWHLPPVYEAALDNLGVHIAMHVAFIISGLLFWWPVVQPLPERARIGDGGRLLYLFVTGFPMAVLALLLVASPNPVYDYYESAPRLWGVSAIADQQVAGIIMGVLGESASFIAMTLLFFRFLDKEEKAGQASLGRPPSS